MSRVSMSPDRLVGESTTVQCLRRFVSRAAEVDVPVLLTGETGTGKSHLARLIHRRSRRSDQTFVTVNCAGIPEGLFESEFFGHRRGAFTGAREARPGFFEQASGGTLLLDEIGELPLRQQAKLLTVLEDGTVRRLGSTGVRAVDVRVLAATCRDLTEAVGEGHFRPDLYHRLALLRCDVAPLRERPEDLEPLARAILRTLTRKHDRDRLTLSGDAEALLRGHSWPGNVRELAHVLEAAVVLSGAETLRAVHVEEVLERAGSWPRSLEGSASGSRELSVPGRGGARDGRAERYSFYGTEEEEREMIEAALTRCRGNRTRAARELGMARNTLRTKMKKYGI